MALVTDKEIKTAELRRKTGSDSAKANIKGQVSCYTAIGRQGLGWPSHRQSSDKGQREQPLTLTLKTTDPTLHRQLDMGVIPTPDINPLPVTRRT